MTPRVRTLVVLALLTASSACAGGSEAGRLESFQSGEKYFTEGRFAEAIIAYRRALQYDPRFGRARFKLAESYAATNELRAAYPEYLRAADLLPDDLDVQVKAGNMLLVARRFQDAKEKARTILRTEPNHLGGLVLLGNALAGLRDLENAVAVTERATDIDPERAGLYSNLGTLQLARGNRDDADRAFAEAVARNPHEVAGWLAQGNFYRAIGDLQRAETSFRQAVQVEPRHARANRVLASLYLDTNRPDRAEPYLRIVAESQNDDGSWMDLADFYLITRRFEEARQTLKQILDRKASFEAQARLALVEHAAGQVDRAQQILAAILRTDPNNAAALALQARLLLREGRTDDALTKARQALQADPQSAEGHFVVGLIQTSRRSLEDARKSFLQVLAINPTATDAKLELARVHASRRELDTAIGYAKETVASQPESVRARLVLVEMLLTRPEDRAQAKAVLDELRSRYPSSAAVYTAVGSFHLSMGERESARRDFERALELDAAHLEALTSLMSLDLADGNAKLAWSRLRERLVKAPTDPDLLLVGAKFSLTVRDVRASEQFLRRLIAVAPASMEAYAMLGQLFIAQNRLADAVREFEEVTRRNPRSAAAHTMLGLLMHREQKIGEAIKHYEKAVEIDPSAITAANNLAWLYAEAGEKLDVALQLATAARGEAPNSAEVSDTLGWVYYRKSMWPLAVTSFEQSIEREPRNSLYHYHLGLALAKAGEDAKARKALHQALALQEGSPWAPEARRVLDSLVY